MNQKVYFLAGLTAVYFLVACGGQIHDEETPTKGYAKVVADASLMPIVDDEWQVFSSIYNEAKLSVNYCSEGRLLEAFLNREINIAILTRTLTLNEERYFEQEKIIPKGTYFGKDAVVFVTNRSSCALLSQKELREILEGKSSKKIIFEEQQSSIFSYLYQYFSLASSKISNVEKVENMTKLIQKVSEDSQYIGVMSYNWWVQCPPEMANGLHQLHLVTIDNRNGKYIAPSQNTLAEDTYPFSRRLYIYDAQGKTGLGLGFSSFLAGEVGQRIMLKSGLLPFKIPPREIILTTKIK